MPKDVYFCGDAKKVLSLFPDEVKVQFGQEIRRLQNGLLPNDSKAMPTVGKGVFEIRVKYKGEYRVFYLLSHSDAIYVLHAFQKKSAQTARPDIDKGKQRIKEYGL